LNVNPDLTPFSGIIPCGITDGTVTSMQVELGHAVPLTDVKQVIATEFWRLLPGFFGENAHSHQLNARTNEAPLKAR
ncbi:MAG: hypothetical protein ABI273_16915, partial [Lacunisphaera sp.]